jgi:Protein of unknown function (DUF2971)
MNDPVTPADRQQYRDFVESQIRTLGKPPPTPLWHYTGGEALIKIIESGKLFSTQIACVNDMTEYRYSVELLHEAFKRLRPRFVNQPEAKFLLDYIDENISTDTSTSEWFITCFSSNRDDLSQWRAYGDGENSYAIGFDVPAMIFSIVSNECLLAPVHYDQSTHIRITDSVADATIRFFLQGWQAKQSSTLSIDQWTQSFLNAWVDDITYLAPVMKHSGFEPECEWRIIHRLQPTDIDKMVFLQKKTLMSRHLPLSYKVASSPDDSRLLPIHEIMVGPSRHKEISKVGVGDLLRTNSYALSQRNVTVSAVPFQQV